MKNKNKYKTFMIEHLK